MWLYTQKQILKMLNNEQWIQDLVVVQVNSYEQETLTDSTMKEDTTATEFQI